MMQTIVKDLTLSKVKKNLETIAHSEGIVNNTPLIPSDMAVDIAAFSDAMKHGQTEYYFAIRQHGTLSAWNNSVLRGMSKMLTDPAYIAIRVERNGKAYIMTINRK